MEYEWIAFDSKTEFNRLKYYYVSTGAGEVLVERYNDWFWCNCVTHWMEIPLPNPPF